MANVVRLDPPIWVNTPAGEGDAEFMIDRGPEQHLQWVVWIHATGECWSFMNPHVRRCTNLTMGRDHITDFDKVTRDRFRWAGTE